MKTNSIDKGILTISQLLQLEGLTIPAYQRPYKWTVKNLVQLFQDLDVHRDKPKYRLGTVVFHQDSEQEQQNNRNIVDGQQRTLTLMLAVKAIETQWKKKLQCPGLKAQLKQLLSRVELFINTQTFTSKISHQNIQQNYQELLRLVSRDEFSESDIDFLLNKCEVVIFTLGNISEAFQFFDSQNARGKDLDPHDLLKAFHLREFSAKEQHLKGEKVAYWESLESTELAKLFAEYLYRIRRWAMGHHARYFGKHQINQFKGLNIDSIEHFPFVESLRITHHFVDDYNQQYQRKIDNQHLDFPFHLDQQVINGRRFFEMITHYHRQIGHIIDDEHGKHDKLLEHTLSARAKDILSTLNGNSKIYEYPNRRRKGDEYVRTLFDCALIFYIDKFGTAQLSRAIERLFIWAYSLRIKQQAVQLATMDNYVVNDNIFRRIKDAVEPTQVLSHPQPSLSDTDYRNNKKKDNAANDPLVKIFKEMNYYAK